MTLKAGIIAAGDGLRLAKSHPSTVKPLVPVAGAPLCHWVADSLRKSGVKEITFLHNSRGRAVRESLQRRFPDLSWTFLEADTASSWESFRLVCLALAAESEEFVISTVDALVPPEETARFIGTSRACGARAGLALTSFIDDEKPLWADLNENGLVSALGPAAQRRRHATSGLYYLTRALALPEAAAYSSLRQFWISLVEGGTPVAGVALSKTVDVDRPEDIRQAEDFLKAGASW